MFRLFACTVAGVAPHLPSNEKPGTWPGDRK